jgi:hypothetical protein
MLNELERLAEEDEKLVDSVVREHKKEITKLGLGSFLLSVIPGMLIGYELSRINFFAGLLGCFIHLTIVRIYYTKPRVNAITTKILGEVQRRRSILVDRELELTKELNNVESRKISGDSNQQ